MSRFEKLCSSDLLKTFERKSLLRAFPGKKQFEIDNFADNENIYGPSPSVMVSIQNSLTAISHYPDAEALPLKQKLSEFLAIPEKNIVIGNGAMDLIRQILICAGEPNQNVLLSKGSFIQFKVACEILNFSFKEVDLNNSQVDLKEIAENIDKDTRFVFFSNPNNPTGTVVGRQTIKEFLEKVPDETYVIIDEAYIEYTDSYPENSALSFLQDHRNLIVLRSFSKIFGLPGLRIGYALLNSEFASCLNKVLVPFSVNCIAQTAALAALEDLPHIEGIREENFIERRWLFEKLKNLGLQVQPSQANFLFVGVHPLNEKTVFEVLKDHGVLVKSLTGYGFSNHHRISILDRKRNEKLIEAYKKALRQLGFDK
ncbi:MAG: histidinol-phosphate transaminase [Bdellovibrionales bacterium]|nr:histidinol-phosphate transaminase [Bdellovibrionales bacterium]